MTTTHKTRVDHLAIARQYVARQNDWPLAPKFDPTQRWYHRLAAQDDHEVWLLTWLPGQQTDLHDHGGSAGAFVIVSGLLTERTVTTTAEPVARADRPRLVDTTLAAGTGRWFGSHHIHQISNDGDRPAVSVHVYGPALETITRYQFDGDRLRIAAIDRAGVQW